MSAGVKLDGFEEFRRALREAPDVLKEQAAFIVEDAANATAAALRAEYPTGETGNLLRGVKVEESSPLTWRARSTAAIASIFEKGSGQRSTRSGANRGVMPAADILIPQAVRQRALMISRLESMVERQTGATFSTSSGLL